MLEVRIEMTEKSWLGDVNIQEELCNTQHWKCCNMVQMMFS